MKRLTHNNKVRIIQCINHFLIFYGLFYCWQAEKWYLLLYSLITYWIIGIIGINIYLHRLLSHKSFRTYPMLEKIFSIVSVITTVGSPMAWVAIHRQHHRSCEKINDPHSPYNLGNFKAWFGLWNKVLLDVKLIKDLRSNRYHRFLHKHYISIILIYIILLSLINPLYIIFIYAIPACLCLHSTSTIIVIAHRHGYKTYDLKHDQSRNSWIANVITLGEGWHNNHHAKPYAWSNWERWWEWDIPALIIRLIRIQK